MGKPILTAALLLAASLSQAKMSVVESWINSTAADGAAVCSAYFMIMTEGAKHDSDTAAKFEARSILMLQVAIEFVGEETAVAKTTLNADAMAERLDGDWANASRLILDNRDDCDAIMNDPESWMTGIRAEAQRRFPAGTK